MHVKRFADAPSYVAPNHRDCFGLQLQHKAAGGPENQWVGLSQFLPGGGAGPDSTPFEKVYVVLEGEMTVTIDGTDTVLGRFDSCTIPAGQIRLLENKGQETAKMLVVMPYPPEAKV